MRHFKVNKRNTKKTGKLKNRKAIGTENMNNKMLKHEDPKLINEILNLFANIHDTLKNTENESAKHNTTGKIQRIKFVVYHTNTISEYLTNKMEIKNKQQGFRRGTDKSQLLLRFVDLETNFKRIFEHNREKKFAYKCHDYYKKY
jgi:hypothetical protein